MENFTSIYRWRVISQNTPFNVQVFEHNQCISSKDFVDYDEALDFARQQTVPVIDDTQLERIANCLESIVDKEKGTLRMVDVERGNVYKTHLGKNLTK
jgi:hypothetical protein